MKIHGRINLPHVNDPHGPKQMFDKLPIDERNPIINPPVLKSAQQQQVDVLKHPIMN